MCFDVFIAVDWSARNKPSPAKESPDSVWIGETTAPGIVDNNPPDREYFRTRRLGIAHVRRRLLHHVADGRRVFVGFDFPYGYPAGFTAALGLTGPSHPWRLIWDELARLVQDDVENRSNRFEVAAELNHRCGGTRPGPLWGCPISCIRPNLNATSPIYPYDVQSDLTLERLRIVERCQTGVQPTWKLYGIGSVGSQCLVGIPAVRELRDDPDLGRVSRVWPFETGFTAEPTPRRGPFVLHAEIWPGAIQPLTGDSDAIIRDQQQVRGMVRWLANRDSEGVLGSNFAVPSVLTAQQARTCVEEEGWLLAPPRQAGVSPVAGPATSRAGRTGSTCCRRG